MAEKDSSAEGTGVKMERRESVESSDTLQMAPSPKDKQFDDTLSTRSVTNHKPYQAEHFFAKKELLASEARSSESDAKPTQDLEAQRGAMDNATSYNADEVLTQDI